MKNAWTPLIWELVIWTFKQWNRQIDKQKPYSIYRHTNIHTYIDLCNTYTHTYSQIVDIKNERKKGLTLSTWHLFNSFLYRLHLFILSVFIRFVSFFSLFSSYLNCIPLWITSHLSHLFEYFILNFMLLQ